MKIHGSIILPVFNNTNSNVYLSWILTNDYKPASSSETFSQLQYWQVLLNIFIKKINSSEKIILVLNWGFSCFIFCINEHNSILLLGSSSLGCISSCLSAFSLTLTPDFGKSLTCPFSLNLLSILQTVVWEICLSEYIFFNISQISFCPSFVTTSYHY